MAGKKNKVSVVIPCYNDGKYLPEAVESVEKCDRNLYELIIVDDGSKDKKTLEVLELMKKRGHRVIHIRHQGQSVARNIGVKNAKESYLFFLDADNKIIPEYITEGIKILDENPEIGVVYGDRQEFGLSEKVVVQKDFNISEIIFGNYIDICSAVRKKVWQDCGGFDKKMFILEDWEFWINAYKHGWKFEHIPKATFYYRIRKGSVNSQTQNKENRIKILRYVYQKHSSLFIDNFEDRIRQFNQKDILINQISQELENKDHLINQISQELENKDHLINQISQESENIKKSISWKFSQLIEKIIFSIFPENSSLRHLYRILIKKVQNFFEMNRAAERGGEETGGWKFVKNTEFKKLNFKKTVNPEVSIIMPVYNNWDYTYNCLSSVLANTVNVDYEIIVADDCSDDKTRDIEKIIKNIKVVRNKENIGFLENCNKAVGHAAGKYLLFLNNDTYVLKDSIFYLLNTIKKDKSIGAVGGKIILPDNTLQEAGSIIWKNGSCAGYGRGQNPQWPEYNFVREVGYCSGAFLMTRKDLFFKLGKFDSLYKPAYYEEVDYCMQLRKENYKIIYQPLSEIVHYESATINKITGVNLQIKNASKFFGKWKKELSSHYPFGKDNLLMARFSRNRKRILYIDDQIPDSKLGSGYPRTYSILNHLINLDFQITFYPGQMPHNEALAVCRDLQQKGAEVMYSIPAQSLNFNDFFKKRKDYYDTIFISRPHNMLKTMDIIKKYNSGAKIIYDAEAIFALRELAYYNIIGRPFTENQAKKKIEEEMKLCDRADKIIAVSDNEKEVFEKYGVKNLVVIGHENKINLTPKKFQEREGLLFVGGILSSDKKNPNFDAVLYFAKEIFPLIRKKLKCNFYIVGNRAEVIWKLSGEGIKVVGSVDDLYEYYNNCRVFVVPTRFSAGIPWKATEAASYGIPMVVTEIIGEQLGWKNYVDCLVGNDERDFAEKTIELYTNPELWNKIRNNSVKRIRIEYSPEIMRKKAADVFIE